MIALHSVLAATERSLRDRAQQQLDHLVADTRARTR